MDEFVGYVAFSDSNIFQAVEWGLKVEVAYVEGGELGAGSREEAVDDEFGKFK